MATIGTDKKHTMEMEQLHLLSKKTRYKMEDCDFLSEYDGEESSLLSLHEKLVVGTPSCMSTNCLSRQRKEGFNRYCESRLGYM